MKFGQVNLVPSPEAALVLVSAELPEKSSIFFSEVIKTQDWY